MARDQEPAKSAGSLGEAGAKGGARRALVAGINDYPSGNHLPSCVNDANYFKELLAKQFKFQDIRLLLNADASAAGITQGLDWLFKGAGKDDRLVFFYSGHGSQRPKDGVLEEYLVGCDLEFIQDDVITSKTADLAPGVLTCVIDACYSGGLEKVLALAAAAMTSSTVPKIKMYVDPESKSVIEPRRTEHLTAYKPFGRASRPIVGNALPERKSVLVLPTLLNAPSDEVASNG